MELTPIFNGLALEWRSDPKLGTKGLFAVLSGIVASQESQPGLTSHRDLPVIVMNPTGAYPIASGSVSEGIPPLKPPRARRKRADSA